MMERYSGACRFILSCNYASRIIDPIQSRCAVFRFRPFSTEQMHAQLEKIAESEGATVDPGAYRAILAASNGDLRMATNLLQLSATFSSHVTEEAIRKCSTVPLRDEVEEMLAKALSGDFWAARDRLYRMFTERGASGEDILKAIHAYLPDLPDPPVSQLQKIELIDFLGEVDFRLAMGASERLQMETILAKLANPASRRK